MGSTIASASRPVPTNHVVAWKVSERESSRFETRYTPTPKVVTLLVVRMMIEAAETSPYSAGARNLASRRVPTRPMAREARLVGRVHAAPRTARFVRLESGADCVAVMRLG